DGFPLYAAPVSPTSPLFQGAVYTEPTNLKQGRVQQFNVNIERQLPGQIVLTAGYAGSRGSHILNFGNNINTSTPNACAGDGIASVPGYTLGGGPAERISPWPTRIFPTQTFTALTTTGAPTTIRYRLKRRPRVPGTASTL